MLSICGRNKFDTDSIGKDSPSAPDQMIPFGSSVLRGSSVRINISPIEFSDGAFPLEPVLSIFWQKMRLILTCRKNGMRPEIGWRPSRTFTFENFEWAPSRINTFLALHFGFSHNIHHFLKVTLKLQLKKCFFFLNWKNHSFEPQSQYSNSFGITVDNGKAIHKLRKNFAYQPALFEDFVLKNTIFNK